MSSSAVLDGRFTKAIWAVRAAVFRNKKTVYCVNVSGNNQTSRIFDCAALRIFLRKTQLTMRKKSTGN